VQNYSSGMKVRLGFAVAAQMDPDVLLIDEVLAVGDVGFRAKCYELIGKIGTEATILLVTHSMPILGRVCSQALVVSHGTDIHLGAVSVGIEKYYQLFPSTLGSKLLARKDLESVEVRILPSSQIESGAGVTIAAKLLCTKIWEDLEVNFVILNSEMLPVCQVSSRLNSTKCLLNPGMNEVSANVPSLQLNPGHYSVSMTIENLSSREKLCWEHGIANLQVRGSFYGNAPYQATATWSVN